MDIEKKRIVIIGGTGLIGKNLANHLLQEGYEPLILTRNPAKARRVFSDRIDIKKWDGIDSSELAQLIESAKAVVNLAGETIAKPWTKKRKERILRSRISTTNALVNAIKGCKTPPEALIQASAIGYYQHNTNVTLDENSEPGTGFLSRVTQQWENAVKSAEDLTRVVIIRTGIVLSADGGFLKKIITQVKLFAGGWFGNGLQKISWIHIFDHVNSIKYLIENKNCSGTYNLVSNHAIPLKELLKKVGKRMGRPIWISIPSQLVKLIFGEFAEEVLLSNQSVIPKKLNSASFRFCFDNIDEALNNLLNR